MQTHIYIFRSFLVVFLSSLATLVLAQDYEQQYFVIETSDGKYFNLNDDATIFKKVLNNEFSRFITSSTIAGLGNYASVKTENNTLTANLNIIKTRSILGINITGGVTNGQLPAVGNSVISSGFGLGFNYHRILGRSEIALNDGDLWDLETKYKKLREDFEKESIQIHNRYWSDKEAYLKASKELATIEQKLNQHLAKSSKDSISKYQEKFNVKSAEVERLKIALEFNEENKNAIYLKRRSKFLKESTEIARSLKDLRATDFAFKWFTLGLAFKQSNFDVYDNTRPTEADYLYKANDFVPSLNTAYSFYSNKTGLGLFGSNWRSVKYFSVSAKTSWDNNSDQLKTKELVETSTVNSTTVLNSTTNVLEGQFMKDLFNAVFAVDYYEFLGDKNQVGYHIQGKMDIGDFEPVGSTRFGLVFPFQNADDTGSFLNLELFFGLNDLFDTQDDSSLISRNIVGLQATLPFNFKIL